MRFLTPFLTLITTTSALALPFPLPIPQFGSSTSSTADDVKNNVGCRAVTVIFARGTSEPGNIGRVIGPPLRDALKTKLGANNVAYQGVPYPASWAGNANGGGNGGQLMVDLTRQALSQCPNTKVILSGYSQGGSVVHKAGGLLGGTKVAGAVTFGDPLNPAGVQGVEAGKFKTFCNKGDKVCEAPKTYAITASHTRYGESAGQAAEFIAGIVKVEVV